MKQTIYNAQTKETTIVDVPDVEMPIIVQEPDADEELAKNIAAATTIAGLKDALLGKYGIARVKGEKK